MSEEKILENAVKLDAKIVKLTKNIRILRNLSWPVPVVKKFIADWEKGKAELPEIKYPSFKYTEEVKALKALMSHCDRAHPLMNFLYKTARSYVSSATMLEYVGTPAFTEFSREIYGSPRDRIWTTSITNLEAAEHFIGCTDDFISACPLKSEDVCLMADYVAEEMRKQVVPFFNKHEVDVIVDKDLASKAAASANRIRIRNFTCFSPMDIPQLLVHEAFVHTLTMLNGREQPNLKTLGLGAPRTTRTQEGLALFAELITTSIDINRLRRIALRVKAIDIAMQGADFIEIFKFFLNSNQDETESFQSAARIFRGGDVKGGVVFTKDAVYLEGLIYIHTFFHKAIQRGKIDYPHLLLSGRLTFSDVVELEPYFKSGFLAGPIYEPSWITNKECLTAFLSYSAFSNQIDLNSVDLDDFKSNERMAD